MKAISLWQPWASAIPLGLKQIETRGWSTKYRGPLVIHAAKRWTKEQMKFWLHCCQMDDEVTIELPFGQLIAVCDLLCVVPCDHMPHIISSTELRYGVYDPGRFGWMLGNIRPIEPVPFKGGQGFFNVPDEVIRYA